MKYSTIGILAHVDAGKTTLSECLMYNLGKLNNLGRVDKGNAFLDTDPLEKERGITIFSKQAILDFENFRATLLDTPGHVDFSAETERTLSVLDAAILVVSGPDKIQSHTRTLWQLLCTYEIPTFIFVNKMDQDGTDKDAVMSDLNKKLSGNFVDFSAYGKAFCTGDLDDFFETIATCDEDVLNSYLEEGEISKETICDLFEDRKVFPVVFGSALKNEGVDGLITIINDINVIFDDSKTDLNSVTKADSKVDNENDLKNASFGARVFKITRDNKEERLTHIKITSGAISVRDLVGDEKVTGIRIYDGVKFENVQTAEVGQIVALTGLNGTTPGQGLGTEVGEISSLLTPVLSYTLLLPDDINKSDAIEKLLKLSEEQPDLSIEHDSETHSVSISLMGEVQTEILKRRIKERFSYDVEFGAKRIIYKETILDTVEGVGHFEPLRHYAEVHLLMEPLEEGSGLVFEADCSEDVLDRNWQRLVLTHLKERVHRGVLTCSPITDMKITLVTGRAHIKHTEGGDFRQATYRAVRNGLMQASSKLLEPYYDFVLELPVEYVGRAMTDLEMMHAKDFAPEINGDFAIMRGNGPVSTLAGYGSDVTSYTGGLGKLSFSVRGYSDCHNPEEVIDNIGYDPERDLRNSADSVFCSHGSGVIVPWNEVKQHMHMPSVLTPTKELTDEQIRMRAKAKVSESVSDFISPEEVDAIIHSAVSANKNKAFVPHKGINHRSRQGIKRVDGDTEYKPPKPKEVLPEYLLVDGYNVIYAWDELKELAKDNLDGARGALQDILCDYQAMVGVEVIAVFDAYKLANHPEEFLDYHNIHVVFTRTAQTADYYIERFTNENRKKYRIRVATSDAVEQVIVRGENATVVSSRDFQREVYLTRHEFKETHKIQ